MAVLRRGRTALFTSDSLWPVQRALESQPRPVHDVGIDLRRRHVHMPEQVLDAADIGPAFQQVRGETVPQRMGGDPLVDLGLARRLANGPLKRAVLEMVTPVHPGMGIERNLARGEEPEPLPGSPRTRILTFQRLGQPNAGQPGGPVLVIEPAQPVPVRAQPLRQALGQHRDAVLVSFARPHHHLQPRRVHVLDPQAEQFHDPQTAAVHRAPP